jgi:UDP-2,3-diacylglucosamine pyrophosphatase LpxH
LLAGNHDDALRNELGALDALRIHTDAGQVHIEHGHVFDAPIKQWREFASVVTWASGRASELGADPLLATLRKLDRALTGEGAELGPIERGALRWLAQRPDVALMCIGHTHRAGVWAASGRTLVNPGDGVRAPIGWLSVDGRNGLAELRRGDHERGRVVHFGA